MTNPKLETVSSKYSNDKRTVGPVTVGAATGGTVGAATAQVIVWLLSQFHVDANPIEGALSIILTAVLGVLGGYLVHTPKKGRYEA